MANDLPQIKNLIGAKDDVTDALQIEDIRTQILQQQVQAQIAQNNLFAQQAGLADFYRGSTVPSTPTPSVIEARIRASERAIDGNNEAVNAWLNGPGMCDRGRAVIAATFILQFERTSKVGKNNQLMLPGFGVFEVTTMYNPVSLGEAGKWPEEVEVLQPVLPYPEIGYPGMRALRHRLAVQASHEEIRAQTKELEVAKEKEKMLNHFRAEMMQNARPPDRYLQPLEAKQAPMDVGVDRGALERSWIQTFGSLFK